MIAIEPVKLPAQIVLEFAQRDRLATPTRQLAGFQNAVAVGVHATKAATHVFDILGFADPAVAVAIHQFQIFARRLRIILCRADQRDQQQVRCPKKRCEP